MRVSQLLLPLVAAGASAFVIPDDDAMVQVNVKTDRAPKFHDLKESLLDAADEARHAITDAFETAYDDTSSAVEELADFARKEQHEAEAWVRHQETNIDDALERVSDFDVASIYDDLKHQTKEWFEDLDLSSDDDHEDDEHHRHPKKPHHPPHHKKPKYTVYELIKKSKYTTRLAEVVDDFPEVVEKLNGSESDFTLFAPTNRAFEKIPKGAKLPKEFLLKLLQYHVVPDVYPAVRVLKSNTLPTVLEGAGLSDRPDKTVQRLAVRLSLFKGATINFFSKLVAVNIRGTNGIVHGVDTLLIPPPTALQLVQGFPAAFSTFELALWKTGLVHKLNESDSLGGTLFTPSNRAWSKMGARANQFLFSRYGAKYLKALLKYHIVPETTLYSDAIYVAHRDDPGHDHADGDADTQRTFHIDLPTLLDDKYLSIDVARWSRFVDIRINGFQNVAVQNVPAYDGVLQIVGNVLIPPKRPGQHEEDDNLLAAEEVSVEELRERLEPFVEHDDDNDDYTLDSVPTEKMAAEQLPLGFGMEL